MVCAYVGGGRGLDGDDLVCAWEGGQQGLTKRVLRARAMRDERGREVREGEAKGGACAPAPAAT